MSAQSSAKPVTEGGRHRGRSQEVGRQKTDGDEDEDDEDNVDNEDEDEEEGDIVEKSGKWV